MAIDSKTAASRAIAFHAAASLGGAHEHLTERAVGVVARGDGHDLLPVLQLEGLGGAALGQGAAAHPHVSGMHGIISVRRPSKVRQRRHSSSLSSRIGCGCSQSNGQWACVQS
jgi:hypothetical protein